MFGKIKDFFKELSEPLPPPGFLLVCRKAHILQKRRAQSVELHTYGKTYILIADDYTADNTGCFACAFYNEDTERCKQPGDRCIEYYAHWEEKR